MIGDRRWGWRNHRCTHFLPNSLMCSFFFFFGPTTFPGWKKKKKNQPQQKKKRFLTESLLCFRLKKTILFCLVIGLQTFRCASLFSFLRCRLEHLPPLASPSLFLVRLRALSQTGLVGSGSRCPPPERSKVARRDNGFTAVGQLRSGEQKQGETCFR